MTSVHSVRVNEPNQMSEYEEKSVNAMSDEHSKNNIISNIMNPISFDDLMRAWNIMDIFLADLRLFKILKAFKTLKILKTRNDVTNVNELEIYDIKTIIKSNIFHPENQNSFGL